MIGKGSTQSQSTTKLPINCQAHAPRPSIFLNSTNGQHQSVYTPALWCGYTLGIEHDWQPHQHAANGALTALTFLRKLGRLQAGQEVLIVGASGSVGSAAVQIARHLGAVVTGVCSKANVALVASLGADQVIDYTREDFMRNGRVYDSIFDTVAKTSFAACKDSLKPKGIYLASAGGLPEFGQMAWTSLTGGKKVVAGVSSERQEDLEFVAELVEAGQFKPLIDRAYPLEQIVEAHRYVDRGHKRGNVVITVT